MGKLSGKGRYVDKNENSILVIEVCHSTSVLLQNLKDRSLKSNYKSMFMAT